ncbi:RNase H domain-containing protein [Abeliophyllum distichum]|uniref:RNase H domain-containing protein n=1 Tax=Abeliophyllum distichum TaxID=126358 RepID=A0ABD1NP66_9LAMI
MPISREMTVSQSTFTGKLGIRFAFLIAKEGIGCRSLKDMSMAFDCKLWWKFRKQESLWSWVMKAKYCRLIHANLITTSKTYVLEFRGNSNWKLDKLTSILPPKLSYFVIKALLSSRLSSSGIIVSLPRFLCLFGDFGLIGSQWMIFCKKRLGIQLASKCQCCDKDETINHVFLNGKCSKEVWDHFCLRLCIPFMKCSHPRSMFMIWITNKHARPGSLFAAVPLLIFWFLWNGRNKSKYNDVKLKATRIIERLHYMLESLLKAGILSQAARKMPSPVAVTWRKPKDGWIKLNTYGALKEYGQAAGGGLISEPLREELLGVFMTIT